MRYLGGSNGHEGIAPLPLEHKVGDDKSGRLDALGTECGGLVVVSLPTSDN